jgi:uncharacterized protein YhdP
MSDSWPIRAFIAVLLPGVNHVLKTVEGDSRGANIATYADPNLPIAPVRAASKRQAKARRIMISRCRDDRGTIPTNHVRFVGGG